MVTFLLPARLATALVILTVANVSIANPVPQARDFDLSGSPVTSAPKIDGNIGTDEYPANSRREGFTDADTNISSDELAEFWLTYDSNFIYFAGRVKTDPRRVVREEYRPNVSLRGNDNLSLAIDPFGSNNSFNRFSANANGATEIELTGGRAAKIEWVGEIESAGRITESGWEMEMRIPWSIMSLPAEGTRDLSFNVSWFRSNKQNTYTYRFTNGDNDRIPKWLAVEVPTVDRSRILSVLPYILTGVEKGTGPLYNAGLDFKTSLTDTIQVVGTVNPDFRNVENSILSLDFSLFERLASENRPFFQEGSRYLRTGFDSRLFAPQRIPTFDVGLNVYGELDAVTNLGALTTIDFGERQATAVTVSRRFNSNDRVELGYIGNSQSGLNNTAALANYSGRSGEYSYFFTNQYTTDQLEGTGWRNNIGANFNSQNYRVGVEYLVISPEFFPRIGFTQERNLKGQQLFAQNEVTPIAGPINKYEVSIFALSYDRYGGGFYRNTIDFGGEIETRSGIAFDAGLRLSNFEGTADRRASFDVSYPSFDPYKRISFGYSEGTFLGEEFKSYELDWRYRFPNRLQINGSSEFVESAQNETQHIVSLNYDLSRYESIGGRLVAQEGDVNWFLTYRLSGRKGIEYFLLIGDPRADQFTDRLVFKAVIPFNIKY